MISLKILIIFVLLFILQSVGYSTTVCLGTNSFTKQYSLFYSENELPFYTPIGWEYHGEYTSVIECAKNLGYTETDFHYTLDLIILTTLLIFISSIVVCIHKLKRKRIHT